MNFSTAFIELEQKIEHLVSRYTKLKESNDAFRREIAFLRKENQRLQHEQEEIEDRIGRIIERVQGKDSDDDDQDATPRGGKNQAIESLEDNYR